MTSTKRHCSDEALRHHINQIRQQHKQAVENVAWLSEPNPVYACGTPVSRGDVFKLRKLNEARVAKLSDYLTKHESRNND